MKRRDFLGLASASVMGSLATPGFSSIDNMKLGQAVNAPSGAKEMGNRSLFLLDQSSGGNAKEHEIGSIFMNPETLAQFHYNGRVATSPGYLQSFAAIGTVGATPDFQAWLQTRIDSTRETIKASHESGVKVYGGIDMIVFPKFVVDHYAKEICNAQGHIDIERPKTQELVRAQMTELFEQFPDLDGLVVRTGEVYLQSLPFHATSSNVGDKLTQGGSAILHGESSHLALLTVLRNHVCEKLGKQIFYRTWDFGENFHENRQYYLAVTNLVPTHPKLTFSIKEQKGDFLRLTVFNPTLLIGQHRQIVEVQCQREVYGKGAHPNYIGKGVIEGWEEYAWLMYPQDPRGLRDIVNDPLYAGMWTWSRGGGWDGPYIPNDMWNELNTFVINGFALDSKRSEADIFEEYSRWIGLKGDDLGRFRKLQLLSPGAVLRGQCTTLGAAIDLWWARDDKMAVPDLSDFLKKGVVEAAILEKHESVTMWKEMEALAAQIHFADPMKQSFAEVSCTYGRIKFAIFAEAWTVMLLGAYYDAFGVLDKDRVRTAIQEYDALWQEWRELKAKEPMCASISHDYGFDRNRPGVGDVINKYRKVVGLA